MILHRISRSVTKGQSDFNPFAVRLARVRCIHQVDQIRTRYGITGPSNPWQQGIPLLGGCNENNNL